MKSELLSSPYAHLKRNRQNSLAASMASTGKSDNKLTSSEDTLKVSLAAAFHDHISCTKSPDLCIKEEKTHMPCETDHIYANCSNSGDSKSGAEESQQRLKDMLLLQLDLIQHQQEQLAKRDRQLQTLRQEKEALKVRLERMERRMSLLKQRKEPAWEQPEGSTSPSAGSPVKVEVVQNKHTGKASYKRPHMGLQLDVSRSEVAVTSVLEPTLEHPWSTTVLLPKTEPPPPTPQKSRPTPQKGKGRGSEGMQTKQLYPLPLCYVRPQPELSRLDGQIEVPKWRYHAVTSCYQLEGTENLDDEIFLRRHHKLEIDEKRRKRWDIQRLREQRHNEKLRRGRTRNSNRGVGGDQQLASFFPQSRDVQYVQVSESVPVVAFGCIVPQVPSSEFSLDWMSRARHREESGSRKRTPIKKET